MIEFTLIKRLERIFLKKNLTIFIEVALFKILDITKVKKKIQSYFDPNICWKTFQLMESECQRISARRHVL